MSGDSFDAQVEIIELERQTCMLMRQDALLLRNRRTNVLTLHVFMTNTDALMDGVKKARWQKL